VSVASSQEVVQLVLAGAGATVPARDPVDKRLVLDYHQDTGSIKLGTQQRDDWWPVLQTGTPLSDQDQDGMSDEWETSHGLDPADTADAAKDRDGDGYSNVEEYLNELAAL
jgi:hypothetical protein